MIRIELWHDDEQLYWAQYDQAGFWDKLKIAYCLFTTGRVTIKTSGNKGTRKVGGREYKL